MRTVPSKDGTSIAFDQSGRGPALILVSGASATRLDEASLAAVLAPDFTVFAYDRRARGDSGDTRPYAVEREVEDIEALIDEAGGSAFVFGHSSGAVLALEAARLLPTKIEKLAVYEPPFIIDDSRSHMPEGFPSHLDELLASGQRGEAAERFMTLVGTPPEMLAGMRQSPRWPQMEANAQSLVYDATIMQDTERGDPAALKKYASVTVPTLVMDGTVIFGRADRHAFMRHGADTLAEVLPNAQRRTLEGQDHGPADDVLVSALKAFFTAESADTSEEGMMVRKIVATELIVRDLAACTAFYRDMFGLQVQDSGPEFVMFKVDDLYFFLHAAANAARMMSEGPLDLTTSGESHVLLAASVENVDAMYADLKAKGVHVLRPPADQAWGLRTAYFTDPEGNFWEIHQPIAAE